MTLHAIKSFAIDLHSKIFSNNLFFIQCLFNKILLLYFFNLLIAFILPYKHKDLPAQNRLMFLRWLPFSYSSFLYLCKTADSWRGSVHIYRVNWIHPKSYFPKQFLHTERVVVFIPSPHWLSHTKNKELISPVGKFCKITLQVFQQNLPTQLKTKSLPSLCCGKGPHWDETPVTQRRAKLFSGFQKWTDVLLGKWRQAPPHTFSLHVLTNIPRQLFRGTQQLMYAKAEAGIITHSFHTGPNSCQSVKFLSSSKRHGVHFVGPWMCSLRLIWEHLKLIMKQSLWMNKYEKTEQTLSIYTSISQTWKNGVSHTRMHLRSQR